MKGRNDILAAVLREHEGEVRQALTQTPDWPRAARRVDSLFGHLVNPKDKLWSKATIEKLTSVYLAEQGNYQSGNITLRTLSAMPSSLRNDTKKIFLQIAEVCAVFNASHKVNFEADELPESFEEVPMVPAKKKGFFLSPIRCRLYT